MNTKVTVTNVDISFGQMIWLCIKFFFAAIIALLPITFIISIIGAVLGVL